VNKVAIITGAGGAGCGRAIARRFARDGASVVVSDIDEAAGAETVRAIEDEGGSAIFKRCDVRQEEQVRRLISSAENRFGGLDYLVNNASAPVHFEAPLDHWKETIETDLLGAVYAMRAAIDAFHRRGAGAIVNMTSISALPHGRARPVPCYDAAKAGLLRLTTMLASLAGSEKIRVNCLAPGWIATPQVQEYWEPLTAEEREHRGAPSRLLSLDEVAGAVLRLATDESLAGRVMIWWSEDSPKLIPWGDRGYSNLTDV
jgi:NAD(P)-dependent dehydrogenase (short-subunit alcohol dehydrogenase family)